MMHVSVHKLFKSNNTGMNYFIELYIYIYTYRIFFYECISVKVTEHIVDPIIVFPANFNVFNN